MINGVAHHRSLVAATDLSAVAPGERERVAD
jgi:hypothetical protein